MVNIRKTEGIDIVLHEIDGCIIGMEKKSLEGHLQKHPDIAQDIEEYLEKGIEVLSNGEPYKNGLIYNGIFLAGYNSKELGCFVINTIHRRYKVETSR